MFNAKREQPLPGTHLVSTPSPQASLSELPPRPEFSLSDFQVQVTDAKEDTEGQEALATLWEDTAIWGSSLGNSALDPRVDSQSV